MTSRNKNGGYSGGTLYREPMGRLVLRYEESKNLSGEAYIQSSNSYYFARNNKNQPKY